MSHLDGALASRYLDGNLAEAESAVLRSHVGGCAECAERLARSQLRRSEDTTGKVTHRSLVSARDGSTDGIGPPLAPVVSPEPWRTAESARVGRYLVLDTLGKGGMGVVLAAFDPELDRKVALKLLRAKVAGSSSPGQAQARLLREAMAKLSHPNVVTIYDVGTWEDRVFMAMELVEGTTLRAWLKKGAQGRREILGTFLAAGRGLAAAHRAGLVHRDFKPENVLVGNDGRVRATDFGLARLNLEAELERGSTAPREQPAAEVELSLSGGRPLDSPLTQAGLVMGTPAYMAPEQLADGRADARSDPFSFCVSLYDARRAAVRGRRRGRASTSPRRSGTTARTAPARWRWRARPGRPPSRPGTSTTRTARRWTRG